MKKLAGNAGESQNAFQERVAKVIQDYTKGETNVNNFRAKMMEYNIPIDAKMDAMIRKHESGDFQSYNSFGKHIFRSLNGYSSFFLTSLGLNLTTEWTRST